MWVYLTGGVVLLLLVQAVTSGTLHLGTSGGFPGFGGEARPTPSAGGAKPLGTPSSNGEVGSYAFMQRGPDGQPARYDPCRTIHVVVNERRMIPDGDLLLESAIAQVSKASGLQFVIEGTTDEEPSPDREPFQPDRYGDRWAPVLIAWSDHAETARLGPEAAGLGGSHAVVVDDHAVYVTGDITLDGAWMQAKGNYGGGYATEAILIHELGHLVGLDHVPDATELMYEENDGQRGLGPGDRAGLAVLGRGPCIPEL